MSSPRLVVVLTAAGRSARFGGGKKELALLGGTGLLASMTVLEAALSPFLELPGLSLVVVTAPAEGLETLRSAFSPATLSRLGERLQIVAGGATRRDSVRAGLEHAAACLGTVAGEKAGADDLVLVHDGARPWASLSLVARVAEKAREVGAALPVTPLTDSPKGIAPAAPGEDWGLVTGHPKRSSLAGAQTPQGFRLLPLLEAHRRAAAEGFDCTDDTEIWARYATPLGEGPVAWVPGEPENRKITYAADLAAAGEAGKGKAAEEGSMEKAQDEKGNLGQGQSLGLSLRVGEGWDLHRLSPDRLLWLGGIRIEAPAGEVAHSDGDVLLHAVIDALLGGAALGDIGLYFPPSDPKWKDADSKDLTRKAIALVREAGYSPVNLDCTVITEKPRLGPHREAIRASLAALLGMEPEAVSVKAKTKEGVDAVGEGRAIEARAVVLLARQGASKA